MGTSDVTAQQKFTTGYKLDDGTLKHTASYQDRHVQTGRSSSEDSASQENYDLAMYLLVILRQTFLFNLVLYDNGLMDQEQVDHYNGKMNIDHRISSMFELVVVLCFI